MKWHVLSGITLLLHNKRLYLGILGGNNHLFMGVLHYMFSEMWKAAAETG